MEQLEIEFINQTILPTFIAYYLTFLKLLLIKKEKNNMVDIRLEMF